MWKEKKVLPNPYIYHKRNPLAKRCMSLEMNALSSKYNKQKQTLGPEGYQFRKLSKKQKSTQLTQKPNTGRKWSS